MRFISWRMPPKKDSAPAPGQMADLPAFLGKILETRGINTPELAHAFLTYEDPGYSPLLLADMDKAVARIRKGLEENEKILVYGDYDCDGVTATVMVYDYLENLGADVLYYIPEREGEGYGLNAAAVEKIHQAGVKLIITVDNGISALDEIALASQKGIDTVVTDHHQPGPRLPEAVAVVDPHRQDCPYPDKNLCGAGVAYKLLCALEDDQEEMLLELYGDILCVATLADVVPLRGENRYLVRRGLELLEMSQREGLQALAREAGLNLETHSSDNVTFGLAPRINAAGRIGSVDQAVELLLCQDPERAAELAHGINSLNASRKGMEEEIARDISAMTARQPQLLSSRVLVLVGENWNPGVIGIVASRVVERYRKPCILLTRMEGGELRGSARSVEGFSIIDAIRSCGDLLERFGGHPMAAGLSMREENLEPFRQRLETVARDSAPRMPVHSLLVDGVIPLSDVTLEQIRQMERLAPFGCENPYPVLLLWNVALESVTPIGGGNHLRLGLRQGSSSCQAVYFGMKQQNFLFEPGQRLDCAVTLSVNTYQGVDRPSVRILSLRPHGFDMAGKLAGQEAYDRLCRGEDPREALPACSFGREAMSHVFRFLRGFTPYRGEADGLYWSLGEKVDYFQILVSLAVLREVGLISVTGEDGVDAIRVLPSEKKADLTASPTYQKLFGWKVVS